MVAKRKNQRFFSNIGIIGCGNISNIYLKNLSVLEGVQLVACADLDMARAHEKAAEFGIEAWQTDELLNSGEIDIVVNLTIPNAHAEINFAALNAGKHIYTEKPLAVTRADGKKTLALAKEKGLRVGGAPDTFLGAGLQTCRRLIDEGVIGVPVAAVAFMQSRGPEAWHPGPEPFYQVGGGPMFDIGPYYLTALVNLLGPIERVTGASRISFPEREVGSMPRRGEKFVVDTPSHVAGLLDFESGPVGTIIMSFDIWAHNLPRLEIYGSEGSLQVPDPNTFRGPIFLSKAGESEWTEVPVDAGYTVNSRGLGVADLAAAVREDRPHRANGDLTYHVLDVMHAINDASQAGHHIEIKSQRARPEPMPGGFLFGELGE
jgi:predicted dehydrogenase